MFAVLGAIFGLSVVLRFCMIWWSYDDESRLRPTDATGFSFGRNLMYQRQFASDSIAMLSCENLCSTFSVICPSAWHSWMIFSDLQMVNLSLRVLSRPDPEQLPVIFKTLGVDYDERVLPSIGNEVLKAVVVSCGATLLLLSLACSLNTTVLVLYWDLYHHLTRYV